MLSCLKVEGKTKNETPFMKNGRILLEELIVSCDGKSNPIRIFSDKELNKATNYYQQGQIIVWDPYYRLYKGFMEGRPISVKKYGPQIFQANLYPDMLLESAITDIVIGSQMSVHKNVLRLIGCCLETTLPILVYEFVGNGTLHDNIFGRSHGPCPMPLSWKCRIKIAADIANAIAYMHTALSRLVILRDIRLSTIILGEDYVPKLTDFSISISIPDGESHVMTDVRGKTGYSPPEYVCSGYVTEKLDVFLFGVILVQLFTGQEQAWFQSHYLDDFPDHLKHYVENQKLSEIICPTISKEGREHQESLVDFATLTVSCMCKKAADRPTITDVARELMRIHRSFTRPH